MMTVEKHLTQSTQIVRLLRDNVAIYEEMLARTEAMELASTALTTTHHSGDMTADHNAGSEIDFVSEWRDGDDPKKLDVRLSMQKNKTLSISKMDPKLVKVDVVPAVEANAGGQFELSASKSFQVKFFGFAYCVANAYSLSGIETRFRYSRSEQPIKWSSDLIRELPDLITSSSHSDFPNAAKANRHGILICAPFSTAETLLRQVDLMISSYTSVNLWYCYHNEHLWSNRPWLWSRKREFRSSPASVLRKDFRMLGRRISSNFSGLPLRACNIHEPSDVHRVLA